MRVTFDELGLGAPILRAVREAGYQQPTAIQTDAIPPALAGRDVLGCAQTGTGKTAAFSLPILQRLDATVGESTELRALVLTPTRELAAQVSTSFKTYGKYLDLWHTVIFGGVNDRPQIDELRRGVDALVATPGRLLDLLGRGALRLDRIEFFVLDEADRMLDMGFLPDVKRVIAALPPERQTLFFSATMPPEISDLAAGLLRDPARVSVAHVATPSERVRQSLYFVDKRDKPRLLIDLIKDHELRRSLVFSRTKHGANKVVQMLDRQGICAAAIHGNKSQAARTRALEGFRSGRVNILVATDIAARGIDVDGITHVINYDLPNEAETYVHRIGRTARAGASGEAISFCDLEERDYLIDIERLLGAHIDRVDGHAYPASDAPPAPTDLHRRTRAGRPPGPSRGRSSGGRGRDNGRRAGGPGRGPGRARMRGEAEGGARRGEAHGGPRERGERGGAREWSEARPDDGRRGRGPRTGADRGRAGRRSSTGHRSR